MCQDGMCDTVFTSVPAPVRPEILDNRGASMPPAEMDDVEELSRKSQFGSLK